MSWNDQDIDQLFKGAKAPEPPPFQEEFWTEMETLLPVQKRRKGVLLWWLSGAAVGALLLGLTGALLYTTRETTPASAPAATAQPAAAGTSTQKEASTPQNIPAERSAQTAPVRARSENGTMANATRAQHLSQQGTYPNAGSEGPAATPGEKTEANTPEEQTPETIGTLETHAFTDNISTFLVTRTKPDPVWPKEERFYVHVAAGIGQSSQRDVANSSGLLHFYAIGGGLQQRADNVILTFGVNARIDLAQNVIGSTSFGEPDRTDTHYNELYSIETPASLGFNYGRNTFAVMLTPGFQAGFSGKAADYEDNVQVRSERTSGKIDNAKTLTMEIGVGYWRTLQPNWYLGVSVNADALRPFNPSNFAGEQRLLPLNGQLMLRRTF